MKNSQILIALIIIGVIGGSIYYYSLTQQSKKKIVISITYNDGGNVIPPNNQIVKENDNLEIQITPNKDYNIKNVLIDDISKGNINNYKLTNIISNHTINVIFEKLIQKIEITKLWNLPTQTADIALSTTGDYIAAISRHTLSYYSKTSNIQLWSTSNIQEATFTTVSISNDGNYVIASDDTGRIYYYSNTLTRTGSSPIYSWTSIQIKGTLKKDVIKLSEDGNSLFVIDSENKLFYFKDCKTKTGQNVKPDWTLNLVNHETTSIAISTDAKYASVSGNVEINNLLYPYISYIDIINGKELWNWQSTFKGSSSNIVLSNDGQKVITALINVDSSFSGIYYWKQATQLKGNNIQYNWYSGEKEINSIYASASQNIDLVSLEDSIKGTVMIWKDLDTISLNQAPTFSLGPKITASTISYDAKTILTLMENKLNIYDPQGNNLTTLDMSITYNQLTLAKGSQIGILWGENGLQVFIIKIT